MAFGLLGVEKEYNGARIGHQKIITNSHTGDWEFVDREVRKYFFLLPVNFKTGIIEYKKHVRYFKRKTVSNTYDYTAIRGFHSRVETFEYSFDGVNTCDPREIKDVDDSYHDVENLLDEVKNKLLKEKNIPEKFEVEFSYNDLKSNYFGADVKEEQAYNDIVFKGFMFISVIKDYGDGIYQIYAWDDYDRCGVEVVVFSPYVNLSEIPSKEISSDEDEDIMFYNPKPKKKRRKLKRRSDSSESNKNLSVDDLVSVWNDR